MIQAWRQHKFIRLDTETCGIFVVNCMLSSQVKVCIYVHVCRSDRNNKTECALLLQERQKRLWYFIGNTMWTRRVNAWHCVGWCWIFETDTILVNFQTTILGSISYMLSWSECVWDKFVCYLLVLCTMCYVLCAMCYVLHASCYVLCATCCILRAT